MSRDEWDEDDRPGRRHRRDDDDYDDRAPIRREAESVGLSVTAMVLGIISVVIMCIWFISLPLAIMAIIFGSLGASKGGKGMAVAGMVCGIVAITIILMVILIMLLTGSFNMGGPIWWNR